MTGKLRAGSWSHAWSTLSVSRHPASVLASVRSDACDTEGVAAEWGEANEQLGRGLPLGRTAYASEIAEAVLFLSSPRSSFITGSTLHADGGGAAV